MDKYTETATLLMGGETYLPTTFGMLTMPQVAALLREKVGGSGGSGDFPQYPEMESSPAPMATMAKYVKVCQGYARKTWYIGERASDGGIHVLFSVNDEMDAEYFLKQPNLIPDEVEKKHKAMKSAGYGPPTGKLSGAGLAAMKQKAASSGFSIYDQKPGSSGSRNVPKPKPVDPEEAAAGGMGSDAASLINKQLPKGS